MTNMTKFVLISVLVLGMTGIAQAQKPMLGTTVKVNPAPSNVSGNVAPTPAKQVPTAIKQAPAPLHSEAMQESAPSFSAPEVFQGGYNGYNTNSACAPSAGYNDCNADCGIDCGPYSEPCRRGCGILSALEFTVETIATPFVAVGNFLSCALNSGCYGNRPSLINWEGCAVRSGCQPTCGPLPAYPCGARQGNGCSTCGTSTGFVPAVSYDSSFGYEMSAGYGTGGMLVPGK